MEVKKEVDVRQFQVVLSTVIGERFSIYMLDDRNRFWLSRDNGKNWEKISLPEVAL
jgi:hypothetical protein